MKLVFARAAKRDLVESVAYIAADNPAAATRQRRMVEEAAHRLPGFPSLGRLGADGLRRLVVPGTSFLLIYRQEGAAIVILRVWHGARQWPTSA